MGNQLQQGDQVTLKSGGPTMVAKHKMGDGTWMCSWFDKNEELKEGYFTEEQLIISKESTN